jgi:hypothetical protein
VALAEALLVVVVVILLGDALLVVVGDKVLVLWAAAGVLGCTSASQLSRKVKPARSTNTTAAIVNRVVVFGMTRILTTPY